MPGLFRCADVFLHLSSDEPFGIVYLEALAMGLPIVAQDGPTTRWLLEDQAWFVDGSDAASVSRALRAALAARDPESCAARRRLVSRRYTWPAVAAQYYDFFRVVAEAVRSG